MKLPPERREAMLEAAAREFAAHGYEGAALNRILEQVGVSKGAAYYYFDDKADLFLTVVTHYGRQLAPLEELNLAALTAETYWTTVDEFYRQPVLRALDRPWAFGAMKAGGKLSQVLHTRGPLAEYAAGIAGFARALLERGQALGVVRVDLPDDLLFGLLMAVDNACDDWMLAHLTELGQPEAEAVLDRVLDALHRLLRPIEPANPGVPEN